MKYKYVEFSSEQLNKSIPKSLLNLLEDNSNIRIIPSLHWEILEYNLTTNNLYSEYNEEEVFNIIDTLLFIINYNFQSSKRMQKEISQEYKKYIKVLENIGIVTGKINFDIENKKCNRYFTCDVDDRFTIISLDIGVENNKDNDVVKYKLDEFSDYTLENSKINVALAIMYNHNKIVNCENYSIRMVMRLSSICRFIHNKRYAKKSKKCDRLYTSFTELSAESRKAVYIEVNGDYHYFHELDMSNAAPCLLANRLYREEGLDGDFLKDTGDGKFYEKIQEEIRNGGEINNKWYNYEEKNYLYYKIRNNDIKTMVCASILYGSQSNKILTDAFYRLYPNEALIINHIKEEVGKDFANIIMRDEASIFLDLDVPVYKFTTHDAVYFINKDNENLFRNEIGNKMKENFGKDVKYKLKPKFNDSCDMNVEIDDSIDDFKIFIVEPKLRKKHKKHKKHKEHKPHNSKNINKVKEAIESGIVKNRDLVEATGLSLATVKRIKNKIK